MDLTVKTIIATAAVATGAAGVYFFKQWYYSSNGTTATAELDISNADIRIEEKTESRIDEPIHIQEITPIKSNIGLMPRLSHHSPFDSQRQPQSSVRRVPWNATIWPDKLTIVKNKEMEDLLPPTKEADDVTLEIDVSKDDSTRSLIESRWINYGSFIGVRPVLVRSGQFSTIVYNFAQLVKDFDILDKNDLKNFILTKLNCKGGINKFTDQLILNNRNVKEDDLVAILREYAREWCTVGSDLIQIPSNTIINDSSNIQNNSSESSDAGIEQEVGASNPLPSSDKDDQSKDGDQLKPNQEDEETSTKEPIHYRPEPELMTPPVFIVGAINNPPQKTGSTAQNKNSTKKKRMHQMAFRLTKLRLTIRFMDTKCLHLNIEIKAMKRRLIIWMK